jgi:ketosteroid isomerase-like protein
MEALMQKLFAILFGLLFTASLLNAQDTAELMKKIQMMNDESAKKMVSGDEAGMWANYTDDVISMPSYEPTLKGLDACKESYKKMNESGMKMTAFKSTVTDIMQSGNFIVDIGTYEITMTMPQMGNMPWTDNGKYMTIWEMQDDGSLKIKVETWNTDANPWEEMQKMQQAPPGESHEGHKH